MSTLFVFFFHKGALVEVQKRNFAYFLMRVVREITRDYFYTREVGGF